MSTIENTANIRFIERYWHALEPQAHKFPVMTAQDHVDNIVFPRFRVLPRTMMFRLGENKAVIAIQALGLGTLLAVSGFGALIYGTTRVLDIHSVRIWHVSLSAADASTDGRLEPSDAKDRPRHWT